MGAPHVHDGDGPDVDPVTGDEAETLEPDERPHFTLEVQDSVIGHSSVLGQTATPPVESG